MRTKQIYNPENTADFKNQLLIWSQQFDEVIWLDSNQYEQKYSSYDAILAVEAFTSIQTDYHQGFEKLKEYQTLANDWVFGYLTYDLKNDVEALKSQNTDGLEFPDLSFFQPKKIFLFKDNQVEIQYLKFLDDEINTDLEDILNAQEVVTNTEENNIKIKLKIHKDEYFDKVNTLLNHMINLL